MRKKTIHKNNTANSARVYSVLVVKTDLEGNRVKKRARSSGRVFTSKQVFDKDSKKLKERNVHVRDKKGRKIEVKYDKNSYKNTYVNHDGNYSLVHYTKDHPTMAGMYVYTQKESSSRNYVHTYKPDLIDGTYHIHKSSITFPSHAYNGSVNTYSDFWGGENGFSARKSIDVQASNPPLAHMVSTNVIWFIYCKFKRDSVPGGTTEFMRVEYPTAYPGTTAYTNGTTGYNYAYISIQGDGQIRLRHRMTGGTVDKFHAASTWKVGEWNDCLLMYFKPGDRTNATNVAWRFYVNGAYLYYKHDKYSISNNGYKMQKIYYGNSSMSVKHCVCARVAPHLYGDGVDRYPPVDIRTEMAKLEAIGDYSPVRIIEQIKNLDS